jgi:hypothetical protein
MLESYAKPKVTHSISSTLYLQPEQSPSVRWSARLGAAGSVAVPPDKHHPAKISIPKWRSNVPFSAPILLHLLPRHAPSANGSVARRLKNYQLQR